MPNLYNIEPEAGMDLCPLCGATMVLQPPGAKERTQCGSCYYSEPAGSAHYMALITNIMVEVANTYGVKYAVIDGQTARMRTCMHSRGLLPLLVSRATELIHSYDLAYLQLFDHGLFNQKDDEAVLGCRVTIKGDANVNSIITTVLVLTEVFEECLMLTREMNDRFSQDSICLECIPGTAAFGENGMKESSFIQLLKEATRQSHNDRMSFSR